MTLTALSDTGSDGASGKIPFQGSRHSFKDFCKGGFSLLFASAPSAVDRGKTRPRRKERKEKPQIETGYYHTKHNQSEKNGKAHRPM